MYSNFSNWARRSAACHQDFVKVGKRFATTKQIDCDVRHGNCSFKHAHITRNFANHWQFQNPLTELSVDVIKDYMLYLDVSLLSNHDQRMTQRVSELELLTKVSRIDSNLVKAFSYFHCNWRCKMNISNQRDIIPVEHWMSEPLVSVSLSTWWARSRDIDKISNHWLNKTHCIQL